MAATLQPPAPPIQQRPQQDFIVPCQAVWPHSGHLQQPNTRQMIPGPPPQPPVFNPSHCHPVFFTDKLRRPPFTLGSGPQLNPVAHGYVYQDATRANGKSNGSRL
ncbi:hypothetical protein B0T21DRAFT_192583 [Apiosordaria backusii]|uniref:Uncharacterized protein n=1 Tax=Apiosordaria backusii TaxID=314023 RepID=A0AA40EEV2_9PEZI|nr:hypothetical protein B0T21DRAFT_192583 [Apiosordaria backusii]